MGITLDLRRLDLERFLLEGRTTFLHLFKRKSSALSNPEVFPGLRYQIALNVNTYKLVLCDSQYEMQDKKAESHLYQLIGWMDVLWEGRRTLNRDELLLVSDNIISSYESLVSDFQQIKSHKPLRDLTSE